MSEKEREKEREKEKEKEKERREGDREKVREIMRKRKRKRAPVDMKREEGGGIAREKSVGELSERKRGASEGGR